MNCIHSNITGLTIGLWFAPHANGGGPCFIELATLPLVGFGISGIFGRTARHVHKAFWWRARRACRAVHPTRPEGVGPQPSGPKMTGVVPV